MARKLRFEDLKSNSQATKALVRRVILETDSKHEMAKALKYCHDWGEYAMSALAEQQLRKYGLTVGHVEHYLPKSWNKDYEPYKVTRHGRRYKSTEWGHGRV